MVYPAYCPLGTRSAFHKACQEQFLPNVLDASRRIGNMILLHSEAAFCNR